VSGQRARSGDGMPPAVDLGAALGSALIGAAAAVLPALRFGAAAGALLGVALALALYAWKTRRTRRRRRLGSAPIAESMRAVLERDVDYYRRLAEPERRRFEREVRWFLDEQVVTGPRGAPLAEHLRVLVAASAVMVIFGRPGFRYPKLRDVVVYEEAFDEEYRTDASHSFLGMVHGQGPILFSARALEQGFADARDGHHVGVHEFAHVLDFATGHADGVPSLMPWRSISPWLDVMHDEAKRIERRRSILREYAATHEAEFFAVATEAFFERPHAMREKHPALYELLRETFGQDPASAPAASAPRVQEPTS
jgi:MtfA peptidase